MEYVDLKFDRVPIRVYPDKVYVGSATITREQLAEIVKVQEEIQPPKIEFQWDTFLEDDDSWDALFFKVNESRWILAQGFFGTEDESKILEMIKNDPKILISIPR